MPDTVTILGKQFKVIPTESDEQFLSIAPYKINKEGKVELDLKNIVKIINFTTDK